LLQRKSYDKDILRSCKLPSSDQIVFLFP
jgi:hypothetical protein